MKLHVLGLAASALIGADSFVLNATVLVTSKHFWPHARGPAPHQYGTTDVTVPIDLSTALAWSWHHPRGKYHTSIAGGPAIDEKKNVYLTTSDGVRKFSPDGRALWYYPLPGRDINNMVTLMGDYVYGAMYTGEAFALQQSTGKEVWKVRPSTSAGPDSGYPGGYDGVFVIGSERGQHPTVSGGNTKVLALDGLTGTQLWAFLPEYPVWNFMPLFPGDDTCVFMDFTGGVYRVGLHNGTRLWHARFPASRESFTDGGATLGANGIVYTCSNVLRSHGGEGEAGIVRAMHLSGGEVLWTQMLPQPCNSYPAVGKLGSNEHLSVVVTPGAFVGTKTMHGGIMAFQAETGRPEWQFQAPVYHAPRWPVALTLAAYGDYQGYIQRRIFNPKHPFCLPAHWSCPSIGGDGTVYAGRLDGKLYIVRGKDAVTDSTFQDLAEANSTFLAQQIGMDYATTSGVKADVFEAWGASLHGASAFAPGMMAFATCDTLRVFRF